MNARSTTSLLMAAVFPTLQCSRLASLRIHAALLRRPMAISPSEGFGDFKTVFWLMEAITTTLFSLRHADDIARRTNSQRKWFRNSVSLQMPMAPNRADREVQ